MPNFPFLLELSILLFDFEVLADFWDQSVLIAIAFLSKISLYLVHIWVFFFLQFLFENFIHSFYLIIQFLQ